MISIYMQHGIRIHMQLLSFQFHFNQERYGFQIGNRFIASQLN